MKLIPNLLVAITVLFGTSLMQPALAKSFHSKPPPEQIKAPPGPVLVPPTVQLDVAASDVDGDNLTFEWRTTDGTLSATIGTSVSWTLPNGPGLHFAYVLAKDGHGGYTEKRVIVSTDDIGTTSVVTGGPSTSAPPSLDIPGAIMRGHLRQGVGWNNPDGTYGGSRKIYPARLWGRPDISSADPTFFQADQKGDIASSKVAVGENPDFQCSYDGGITNFYCGFGNTGGPGIITGERAHIDYTGMDFTNSGLMDGLWLVGNVLQTDGSRCGMRNFFFGTDVTATVRVTTKIRSIRPIKDRTIAGDTDPGIDGLIIPINKEIKVGPRNFWYVNSWGDYYIPTQLDPTERPLSVKVKVNCEAEPAVIRPVTLIYDPALPDDAMFVDFEIPNTPPTVTALTATLGTTVIAQLGGPGAPKPSDVLDDPEHFLGYKGLDSRMGSCQYYRAIGVVSGCDSDGGLQNPITFDRWKQEHKMAPYNESNPEYTASFVNEVDLNLTRIHTGTHVGQDHLAFVVCNFLGPTDPSQPAVDLAVANAQSGRNLVACVAMDYSISPGVNSDQPFIKFMIFGPSGELLPSINLDGRREKFVPGVCVACHGGEHYAGSYPENGTGVANVGASYLPYDVDNFAFSSQPGLTQTDQLDQIKLLNELLLLTQPVQGMADLITAWYASGSNVPDESYVPPTYAASQNLTDYYQGVIKPFCRTCHVAYGGSFNSEDYNTFYDGHLVSNICGGSSHPARGSKMPNSQVTYDKMMTGPGIDAYRAYLESLFPPGNVPVCTPGEPSNIWPSN
jgi:mono/diheme cytochrome c family protein